MRELYVEAVQRSCEAAGIPFNERMARDLATGYAAGTANRLEADLRELEILYRLELSQ